MTIVNLVGTIFPPSRQSQRIARIQYKIPDSWFKGPLSSKMRKLAFLAFEGSKQAEITVISFPSRSDAFEWGPNVNRWRKELGLKALPRKDADESGRPIKVGGRDGKQIELGPSAGDEKSLRSPCL